MVSAMVQLSIYGIVAILVLSAQLTVATPPHQCAPGLVEELPLKLKKICAALYTLADFSREAASQYIDEKGQAILGNVGGIKRQDDGLDHMFMRFGKRGQLRPGVDLSNLGGIKRQDDGLDHMFMRFGRG